ncbi:phosphoribosylglycinamide formyltransferase [Peribacillus cavernae]|uniref:Phosphoribosylglycinamide formyltransferase n=1 Tax=Peribacillus cavernae TaxID=1674310 RepID=A0A433HFV6_9BACI|nr:phosphoribosylglycinamide formyltransferase [Peribacillus cavernae]MDQ0219840.1 phosphoribosylglycinamide formyltransferase-1 [Peribacillus cavernae]RUQ27231.1 phosphoribosylglycinamide formyltransferase [Peribacillus cavernae]
MKKIAVFASGNGSNFQAIVDAKKESGLDAEICLVVSDKKDAFVLRRADSAGIETFCFTPKEYKSKEDFETVILTKLRDHEVEFIVLAGYMRLIGPTLLHEFPGRIINIHPSLLPAFPGRDAIGQAFAAKVKITGVTVHFVDEGMDTGPIIAQQSVPVLEGDTRQTLQQRIQGKEHELYPLVLKELLQKNHNIHVEG